MTETPVRARNTLPVANGLRPQPASVRSRSSSIMLAAMMAVALCLSACTDQASIGPEPEYLELVPLDRSVIEPRLESRIRIDSCPTAAPLTGATTRRALSRVGATIALPASVIELTDPFAGAPGSVFRVPAIGIIAVGYDDRMPRMVSRGFFRSRNLLDRAPTLSTWCPFQLDGRLTTLYAQPYPFSVITAATVLAYADEMAITAVAPDGRRVNIFFSADQAVSPTAPTGREILRLLPFVASIQW